MKKAELCTYCGSDKPWVTKSSNDNYSIQFCSVDHQLKYFEKKEKNSIISK